VIDFVKKVVDMLIILPDNPMGSDAQEIARAKSECFKVFDYKRVSFSEVLEKFYKLMTQMMFVTQWNSEWLEETVWGKFGTEIVKLNETTEKTCSEAMMLKKHPPADIMSQISGMMDDLCQSLPAGGHKPPFIPSVLSTKRFEKIMDDDTFTNINRVSRGMPMIEKRRLS